MSEEVKPPNEKSSKTKVYFCQDSEEFRTLFIVALFLETFIFDDKVV